MISRRSVVIALVLLAVVATLPFWALEGNYLQGVGVRAMMVAAMAVAWNIIGGLGGRLSFGHAAFFGIGAYTSTLLLLEYDVSPWVGGVVGLLLSGVLALVLGAFTLHLRGIYFTLVTFVFALILLNLSRHFIGITGGDVGLNVPLGGSIVDMQFGSQTGFYFLCLALLAVYVAIGTVVGASPLGYRLRALRDDEDVARAVGVATTKVKLQAFVLSAVMVSFVGTVTAQYELFIDPASAFGIDRSVEMAVGAIFGGIGTVLGPVIGGAAIVVISEFMQNALRGAGAVADTIAYGVVLMVVALWLPKGLISLPDRVQSFVRRGGESASDGTVDENVVQKAGAGR